MNTIQVRRSKSFWIALGLLAAWPAVACAEDEPFAVSGNLRTLNVLSKRGPDQFTSAERARIKMEWKTLLRTEEEGGAVSAGAHVEYDNQVYVGNAVGRPAFNTVKRIQHQRQQLDLSRSIVDEERVFYEQALYRAYVFLHSDTLDVNVGRQQIPWGVGRFVTPTDVFNPLSITSLEPEEREGVDAVDATLRAGELKINYVFTPRGRRLHPERHGVRVSGDVAGAEVGVLGGTQGHDEFVGYDVAGNVGSAVVRHEFLYHDDEGSEDDYVASTVNADYNFSNGLYALLEYAFNGQGESKKADYQILRLASGEIRHLARHYVGLGLGYDITPLIRVENHTFANLSDSSFYNRPELSWSIREDLIWTMGAILMLGNRTDEFNRDGNLFYQELKWFF